MAPAIDACIEQAIDVLGKYFPEDAALLRAGRPCETTPHSKNGWLSRPMGRLLHVVPHCVSEMRNPHPTSSPKWREREARYLVEGVLAVERAQLQAWGRE